MIQFRFGETCSQVEKRATSAALLMSTALVKLDEKIKETEENIKKRERWVNKRVHRLDPITRETEVSQKEAASVVPYEGKGYKD